MARVFLVTALAVLLVGSHNFQGCLAGIEAQRSGAGINSSCNFSAVFNFGDSNSDSGGLVAGLGLLSRLPNGETFFKYPTGRYCDGRLVIDFLCEGIRLPFLSPYLESVGSSFRHGANFAIAGATVNATNNPFPLPVQINQFKRFKALILDRISQGRDVSNLLPSPDAFDKALYTFDIGQNDISHAFNNNLTEADINSVVIPQTIQRIMSSLKELYSEGARNFVVHNTGPLGCLPRSLTGVPSEEAKDEYGCVESYNRASQTFNAHLKAACSELRSELPLAAIVYVDIYSIKYSLIANASKYGFEHPLTACCGYGGFPYNFNDRVRCSDTGTVNGTLVTAGSCKDPTKSVSWDGIHYSETANFHIWSKIISAKFSDPPLSPYEACR